MLDKLQNNDTIITTNNIKNIILKDLAHTKKLLNLKFYTLKEFLDNFINRSRFFIAEKVTRTS